MRTIGFILQKEFRQIFRNRSMLPIIFAVPIIQLLIIVHAATFEMKNIHLAIVDHDHSTYSRELISHFQGSPFFRISNFPSSTEQARTLVQSGKADAVLQISRDFGKDLAEGLPVKLQLEVNAINGVKGGLTNAYALSVIGLFNRDVLKTTRVNPTGDRPASIDITSSFWYNPEMDYKVFMVPGILVLLVTIISLLLSSMNIVREKEIGTIEQINVTPIRKSQFIAGKLLPFLMIALFELAFGLGLGKLLFQIPTVGSFGLIFLVAVVYITVILSMGLFLSTLANTQQQAMFVSFFFMIIFILMSGLFTATENMPHWAQWLNRVNPVAYFIRIMRMILLKGSGFNDIKVEFYSLLVLSLVALSLAIRRYRKIA